MKNKYLKNILIILSGGVLAQLIGLMAMPVLSRLYSPDHFGFYATFVALLNIFLIVATLRLDFAIQIAKRINEIQVLKTIIFTSTYVLIVVLILIYCLISHNLINNSFIDLNVINVDPIILFIAIFFAVTVNVGMSENIWHQRFSEISRLRVVQALLLAILGLLFSLFSENGLIFAHISSAFIISSYFIIKRNVLYFRIRKRVKIIFTKFSKFPKYSVPSDLFNSFSNASLPLIVTAFYAPELAGLYFMADRIIKAPLGVLYQSVSSVYTENAGKLYNRGEIQELISLTNFTQIKLALILAPVLMLASISSEYFFSFLFGDEWKASGEIVKYFSVFIFFNGLYSPISQIGNILGFQKYLLYFNFSLAFFMTMPYVLLNDLDFYYVILISSIIGSFHFIILNIFMQIRIRCLL